MNENKCKINSFVCIKAKLTNKINHLIQNEVLSLQNKQCNKIVYNK